MKAIIISIFVAVVIIGGAFVATQNTTSLGDVVPVNNVSVVDGKQIIEIRAKGGYQPRKSVAQANIPTVIRFLTNGTFDCSSSIRISSLNISAMLPQSGATDIEIGSSQPGLLKGSCGMGMYPFEIEFQS